MPTSAQFCLSDVRPADVGIRAPFLSEPCQETNSSIIGSTTRPSGSKLAISQARRLPAMKKLVLTGLTHPGEFELEPGFNTLGRNPTNDYRVHDSTVSSFHCEIVLSDDSVLVRDLGSTNGTFIDNQPVHEAHLEPGQVLRLGSAELRLESQPMPEPLPISVPELTVEPPLASVTLPDGSLSCLNHHDTRAVVKCVKCEKVFCEDCLHVLRLAGGKKRVFCPACSGHCELLPDAPGAKTGQKKRLSLLGRLTQTIRIRLK